MTPILATKLYIPSPRPKLVRRTQLINRLNEGLYRRLTLISAPAGFGKTTLVSAWLDGCGRAAAWLSLDEGENDPERFLAYLVAALQTITATIGVGVSGALRSQQPASTDELMTALLNDIATISDPFILVLDDYHLITAEPVDRAVTFLIEHLPRQMHLVISSREDPHLPLARLRVQDCMTELRETDLRFTATEAGEFLTKVMGLPLGGDDIAVLEQRTEGWIAGLQLAALSLQGRQDIARFISSFTGNHQFVLDYLVEEVLRKQPAGIQTFLLRTSILDRLTGPLCDAVVRDPATSGQATLEYLEHANLFLVPLDHERRWYRYHQLFVEVLRQRLQQSTASSAGEGATNPSAEFHRRASLWYEEQGLELDAFHHAAAANDIDQAARLLEGNGMPLHFQGGVIPILDWLESLPASVLDSRPALWVIYASALSIAGHNAGVESRLRAAEAALQRVEPDNDTRNLIGQIAAIRATLAANQYQVEVMIAQARRALEYLHPDNLNARTGAILTLGYAYQLQGDRAAARRVYTEAIALSQASGHAIVTILATIGLGNIQEAENQLTAAAETYRHVLDLLGEPPLSFACEAHLGLARISYEWNDLDAALAHGQASVQLARQIENADRYIAGQVVLARLKLAEGDVAEATRLLAEARQSAHQRNFVHHLPEIAAVQVLALLHQGDLSAAAEWAQAHDLPLSQARVHLAYGNASAALSVLEPWRAQVEARELADESLKALVLQALALDAQGEEERGVHLLLDALALAEAGGFIRTFVDEGAPMAHLLATAKATGKIRDSIGKLLAAFAAEKQKGRDTSRLAPTAQPVLQVLSPREMEVLQLIAQGLSNQQIAERLFLALDTVKGHNQSIFGKLQVQRRTEAVARARARGLL